MKIKGSDFDTLKRHIDHYIKINRDLSGYRDYCVTLCPKRPFEWFCWAVLTSAINKPTRLRSHMHNLYRQNINDNHINTALKIILKDYKESKV